MRKLKYLLVVVVVIAAIAVWGHHDANKGLAPVPSQAQENAWLQQDEMNTKLCIQATDNDWQGHEGYDAPQSYIDSIPGCTLP